VRRVARYIWLRHGQHRDVLEQAIEACAAQHRGTAVGRPTVVVHQDGDGNTFTGLEADGDWWLEYMRVHGRGWTGPISRDEASDILDPDPPIGG
jgi:hypothetical protein